MKITTIYQTCGFAKPRGLSDSVFNPVPEAVTQCYIENKPICFPMKNKSKQSTSQPYIKTTMQNTTMIDLFKTNKSSLDVIPPGVFYGEDEISPGKKYLALPIDVLVEQVRSDEEVSRKLAMFLSTPEGKNLQYQFHSGLVDEYEYALRRKELFSEFLINLDNSTRRKDG